MINRLLQLPSYKYSHSEFSRPRILLPNTIIIVAALLFSGCSLAPGMHFDRSNSRVADQPGDSSAVIPIIKTITPELIQRELSEKEAPVDLSELMAPPQSYTIGAGDELAITVWDQVIPAVNMTGGGAAGSVTPHIYTVSAEGKIQFPYAGDFIVTGLTQIQARDLLVERLSNYIKKPEVTLRVAKYRSKRVYMDGEVKIPGIVNIDDIPLSLPEALNRAGGITTLGDQSRISITRNGKTFWINLPSLVAGGMDPSRIMLSSGDMLRVSSREESKVFVVGEVSRPVTLTLRNGRLSLNEALGEAGGINPITANAHQVYVIRNAHDAQPLVYHLDAQSPVMFALAENFNLKAKDVVYVDATSIVRFNRIISLILPTAQTITIINRGFQ